MANYNASQVGVLFVDITGVNITFPDVDGFNPSITINQAECVKMLDGTTRYFKDMSPIQTILDIAGNGNTVVPLVDLTTGLPTGENTTINQMVEHLISVIRSIQIAQGM